MTMPITHEQIDKSGKLQYGSFQTDVCGLSLQAPKMSEAIDDITCLITQSVNEIVTSPPTLGLAMSMMS